MQTNIFSDMDLSEEMKHAIKDVGFEEATEVQKLSIPLILEGKDVIGHSQTGTGKTAAFCIPAIEKMDLSKGKSTQVLILCPTRELAMQASDEIRKFTKYKHNIKTVAVYGGQQIVHQIVALRKGAQIVVGTPGRIMDHMRRKTLKFNHLSMLILDEADEMLSMGFREDIETILKGAPEERQTVLFSATMSKEIIGLTKKYQSNPEMVKVTSGELTVSSIDQFYYNVSSGKKMDVLSYLLKASQSKRSMVFCNTKNMVDKLVDTLKEQGHSAEGLHGDIKQSSRTKIMNSFKSGDVDILVATDVAARGIDVDDIEVVFNYDIPQDVEYYVHRIGRTGRAGKKGQCFTFVSGRHQMQELKNIQKYTKSIITVKSIPTQDEVRANYKQQFSDDIREVIEEGELDKYQLITNDLLENFSKDDVLAALVKMTYQKGGREEILSKVDESIFVVEEEREKGRSRKRKERRPRDRKPALKKEILDNMTTLSINVGTRNRVNANHILGAVAGESGLSGKSFGRIVIHENYTLVSVPDEHVNVLLQKMKNCRIKGRRTTIRKV